jgi:hypothetical protein
MSEFRAFPRHPHRLIVRLRGMLPVRTRDVSESGFQADMLQPLHRGSTVRGSITLDGEELPFEGEVVWVRVEGGGPTVRGRFAVRFTSGAEDFRQRFQTWRRRQGHRLVRWFT